VDQVGQPRSPSPGWWAVFATGNRAGPGTPPVGAEAARRPPVIALFPARLALRASDCNRCAQPWGSGQGCKLDRERWQAAGLTEARRQGPRQLGSVSHPSCRRCRFDTFHVNAGAIADVLPDEGLVSAARIIIDWPLHGLVISRHARWVRMRTLSHRAALSRRGAQKQVSKVSTPNSYAPYHDHRPARPEQHSSGANQSCRTCIAGLSRVLVDQQ